MKARETVWVLVLYGTAFFGLFRAVVLHQHHLFDEAVIFVALLDAVATVYLHFRKEK